MLNTDQLLWLLKLSTCSLRHNLVGFEVLFYTNYVPFQHGMFLYSVPMIVTVSKYIVVVDDLIYSILIFPLFPVTFRGAVHLLQKALFMGG